MTRTLALLSCLLAAPAWAQIPMQANTKPAPVTVQTAVITVDCSWAPGTIVWQPNKIAGGDGTAITWSLSGTADLVINPTTGVITVAPTGIPPTDCGKQIPFTVTPSQQ